ncbi:RNA polymerase sigma factor [Demequina sp.]|uniref:RNA polymerase sigma factor n=1 Tax=Demequina sp. TaxID=2050685 RepID=UPI003A837710
MAKWEPLLAELIETRRRDLVAYARMLTGSLPDAEDLVQDALVEAFGGRARFTHVAQAEAYTRKVIASRFIDGTRRKATERKALGRLRRPEVDTAAGPDLLAEHRTDVTRALQTLPARERACVVLRYLQHLTIEETAEQLGLSAGSVKRYVHDGVARLNTELGTTADQSEMDVIAVEMRRV